MRPRSSVPLFVLALVFGLGAADGHAISKAGTDQHFGPSPKSPQADARQAAVSWAKTNAIPLSTTEAGHGIADMQPLRAVVGDARIVALGEATHGTHEFFQLKHRLLEFLTSKMGFTIFSIEASMPEAYRLNDFVLHGNGDPKELLKGMLFWTWDTQEVLDMILWMREFNQSGKGKVEFTGFDMQFPILASENVEKFVLARDPSYIGTLEQTYQEVEQLYQRKQGGRFGVATARLPLAIAAGKKITYSGYIKTLDLQNGWAGLWLRVDEDKRMLAFDNMESRGPTGTTPWTRYEISVDVPVGATNINFGVLHTGKGTAWFDSLKVDIDGRPYDEPNGPDLDFESDPPRGFYKGGEGYQVAIDRVIAHTGAQSLRSTWLDSAADPSPVKGSDRLADKCEATLKRLEEKRADTVGMQGADIEWAIQNARLVLQYVQMQAGTKSRDQSMAENVEWIAKQNPKAKIILWAHNAHVGFESPAMGTYLREAFRDKYINFGFAFDQGAFRASTGSHLEDFAVGPAPPLSLDGVLSSVGLPLFVLDLRHVSDRAAADWLDKPHAARSIGALYDSLKPNSAFTEVSPRRVFDIIVFVSKTTAARSLP